jgi:hypothetical protein
MGTNYNLHYDVCPHCLGAGDRGDSVRGQMNPIVKAFSEIYGPPSELVKNDDKWLEMLGTYAMGWKAGIEYSKTTHKKSPVPYHHNNDHGIWTVTDKEEVKNEITS